MVKAINIVVANGPRIIKVAEATLNTLVGLAVIAPIAKKAAVSASCWYIERKLNKAIKKAERQLAEEHAASENKMEEEEIS